MTKTKKLLCIGLSALLAAGIFSGCGKKATDSGKLNENNKTSQSDTGHDDTSGPDSTPYAAQSVPHQFQAEGDNVTKREDGGVDVALEAREGDDRYEFENDDMCFVDTMSGAIISIGMSIDDVESLIGEPRYIDAQDNRFYSGIAVKYDDNMNVERLVVATGNMEQSDDPERFVTSRGIRLGATEDEFASAYGDQYNDPQDGELGGSASRAVRYYTPDGDGYKYAGNDFNVLVGDNSSAITQSFIFSPETKGLSVISIERGV